MTEKKTEYVPVVYELGRPRSYPRPVHLRRIVKIRIGSNFRGEPTWSQYPDRDALCGVHATERSEGPVSCPACKRLNPEQEPAGNA
jgi:hypothetical protein